LFIENINTVNFRNYENLNVTFQKEKLINLIIAPNGSGKSNLLEMIYYLSYLRPFRNVTDKELVNKKNDFFFLEGKFYKKNIFDTVTVKFSKTKEVFINKKKIKKFSDVLGVIVSVLFSSDDIFIIVGNPTIRRKFFDMFLSIVDKEYLYYLSKYQNLLKQKNFILKKENSNDLLDVYDLQMSQCIEFISKKRFSFVEEISLLYQNKYNEIGMFKEKVKIIYSPSIKNNENIIENLKKNRNIDIEYGFSSIGPHRDNYLFLINGVQFNKFASLGQTRLASLVLKIVQAEYFKMMHNDNPILLIDDVILELDSQRQKRFLNNILQDNQIFITLTDKSKIDFFENKNLINEVNILDGNIGKII